jgi:periplasmic protein TonB
VRIALDQRGGWDPERREGFRWTAAALVVVGLHVLGAIVLRGWQIPVVPAELAPAAIMMDLEPAPVPVPQAMAMPEEPLPEPEPEIVAPPPPPPEIVPEVVLPQAVPKPKPPQRKRVEHKRIERVAPVPVPAATSPAPPAEAPVVPVPPTPSPSAAANAMTRFERLLSSHLEREKRYPRLSQQRGEQGTVMLRFTMNRDGKVLAARIERGSGFAALDQEVLALIERAQPLPALPAEITAAQLELVVPVQFSMR